MGAFEGISDVFSAVFTHVPGWLFVFLLYLPLLILSAILIPIFMIRGYKKGLYLSLVSLAATIISYILSVLISKPVAKVIASFIYSSASKSLSKDGHSVVQAIGQSSAASAFLTALLTVAVAGVIFVLVFLVLMLIAKIVSGKLLNKALAKDDQQKAMRIGGMFVRMFDAILLAFLFFVPFYASMHTGAVAASELTERLPVLAESGEIEGWDQKTAGNFRQGSEILHSIRDALPTRFSGRESIGFAYRIFGSFSVGGETFNASEQLIRLSGAASNSIELFVKKPSEFGEKEKGAIDRLINDVTADNFISALVRDGLNASESFINPKEGDKGAQLISAAVDALSGGTNDEINGALKAIGASMKSMIDHGVFSAAEKESGGAFDALSNKALVEDLDRELRSSALLSRTSDALIKKALDFLKDPDIYKDPAFEKSMYDIYAKISDTIDRQPIASEVDRKRETDAFVKAFSGAAALYRTSNSFDNADLSAFDTDALSDVIIGVAMHPYIGEETAGELLRAFLPHLGEKTKALFTDSVISSVIEKLHLDLEAVGEGKQTTHLSGLLRSTKNLVLAFGKMSDKGAHLEVEELVGQVVNDLTPDTAKLLSDSLTAEAIEALGVDSSKSAEIGAFVGDLLENAAAGNSEADRKAISQIATLVVGAKQRAKEQASEGTSISDYVGSDLKGFIRNAVSSDAMANSIKNAVERSGVDPTGAFEQLSAADRRSVQEACREVLIEYEFDPDVENRLNDLCSFMGVRF